MTHHFGDESEFRCRDCKRGWCFAHATYTAEGANDVVNGFGEYAKQLKAFRKGLDGHIAATPLPWPACPDNWPHQPCEAVESWFRNRVRATEEAMELVIASLGYLPMVDWGR